MVQKLSHPQGIEKNLKLAGKFNLEAQGHQFSTQSETLISFINTSNWKVKFQTAQYLTVKIKILQV